MTNKKLIAIGVDQNGLVRRCHYGESPQFFFNSAGNLQDIRRNPYVASDDGGGHHGKPGFIVELLPECAVFIGWRMGKPEKLIKLGLTPYLTIRRQRRLVIWRARSRIKFI